VRPNVDSNDLGFGRRIDLAAKADATLCYRVRPKCCPSPPRSRQIECRQRDQVKAHPGPDPGWARAESASNRKSGVAYLFDRQEKTLGVIQQVQVRQQVHGEITTKPSVAVAAVTTDSSHLGRALIEMDVVGLVRIGG
jgi:hypothetical protein